MTLLLLYCNLMAGHSRCISRAEGPATLRAAASRGKIDYFLPRPTRGGRNKRSGGGALARRRRRRRRWRWRWPAHTTGPTTDTRRISRRWYHCRRDNIMQKSVVISRRGGKPDEKHDAGQRKLWDRFGCECVQNTGRLGYV